jgi:alkaline phosphatase D
MKRRSIACVIAAVSLLMLPRALADDPPLVQRIAFGSCAKQDKPQPIWDAVVAAKPDAFIFLGDNIYGDSDDVNVLRQKYAMLAAVPGFQKLRGACRLLATWDDHDYGRNDAGVEFAIKDASREAFFDFIAEPADSPRRRHQGVYDAVVLGPEGRRVQVILLDTRYFRSPLKQGERGRDGDGQLGRYLPDEDPAATMLGQEQWRWLEEQLRAPAEVRILASSIQVVAEDHRFEKWANFPRERERLLRLIHSTNAAGVIAISGDRHLAELSRLEHGPGYPLYDITSSALNQTSGWYNEINRHRWSRPYSEPNFGLITIDWTQSDPAIQLEIRKENGDPAIWHEVKLSALRAAGQK